METLPLHLASSLNQILSAGNKKNLHLQLETPLPLPFTALALSQVLQYQLLQSPPQAPHHASPNLKPNPNPNGGIKTSHLILTLNDRQSQELVRFLSFFHPHIKPLVLPQIEKTHSSPSSLQQKCSWLYAAQNPNPRQVLIAPIESLMEKVPPPSLFKSHCLSLQKGDEIPKNFEEIFIQRGYESSPLVEYPGQYAFRGHIVDFFSPHYSLPCRVELFGDKIEALWHFFPEKQRNEGALQKADLIPCNTFFYFQDFPDSPDGPDSPHSKHLEWRQRGCQKIQKALQKGELHLGPDFQHFFSCLRKGIPFPGIELLRDYFFQDLQSPLSFMREPFYLWVLEPKQLKERAESFIKDFEDFEGLAETSFLSLKRPQLFFNSHEVSEKLKLWNQNHFHRYIDIDSFHIQKIPETPENSKTPGNLENSETPEIPKTLENSEILKNPDKNDYLFYPCFPLKQKFHALYEMTFASPAWTSQLQKMLQSWKKDSFSVFICCSSPLSLRFMETELEEMGFHPRKVKEKNLLWGEYLSLQKEVPSHIHLIPQAIDISFSLEEDKILFIAEKDLWNRKTSLTTPQQLSTADASPVPVPYTKKQKQTKDVKDTKDALDSYKKIQSLSFSDIQLHSLIVHTQYGIGRYMGLKEMNLIPGVRAEFIEINYAKDEKLYLPIYKLDQLQKYQGSHQTPLDHLGSQNWKKRRFKVKEKLREMASELLDLYAKRQKVKRKPFHIPERDYLQFASQFPYMETPEQQKSIQDVLEDMQKESPMDRLVCGDVGFGKTEVALRASFVTLSNQKQVVIICPTTLLSFQHFQNFKNRFHSWPFEVLCFNRFMTPKQLQKNKEALKTGKPAIAIGTHLLLHQSLELNHLGLLIIDEEHKFGVTQKEKLRKIKIHVDTLALSATPIPRTLHMSLTGIRNLSLIHTPPPNRLPIKTMSISFEIGSIRKIVKDELSRGGQIFFIHNRVHSIPEVAENLQQMLKGITVRIAIAHGQQSEKELEDTMIQFINKKTDLLISTNIVEAGMDIPNVNTLFVHKPEHMGLSQMYQLRGRVGRGSRQAYCYFLLPAGKKIQPGLQRRLSVLHQHSHLGSGIHIAQHDMELRGSGDLLGKNQSGNLNAVGYELYMDLLKESLSELKGEKLLHAVEPDISISLPALIPQEYMEDIRTRLHYYKSLASAQNQEDLEEIQREIEDQFGNLPEELENLCLLMLIKNQCKRMNIQNLKAGKQNLLLHFIPDITHKEPDFIGKILQLVQKKKSYTLRPPDQLAIRLKNVSWISIQKELDFLLSLLCLK